MQLSSELGPYTIRPAAGTQAFQRSSSVHTVLLVLALAAIVLAFVPLVPPVDAMDGGMTTRGVIEFGLIFAALGVLALCLHLQGAFSFDLRTPGFLLISLFAFWGMLSSLWSLNPLLTIAKTAELWCLALGALMIVTLAARSQLSEKKLATILAWSMIAVVGGLLLANIFYWGKPLPNTGDDSLPLDLLGQDFSDRPRLILAYQHALSSADLLATAIICCFVSDQKRGVKAVLIACLLALFWLVDARGSTVALVVALSALSFLKLRKAGTRAVALMVTISIAAAGALVFQDNLPAVFRPLLTDDVYTLNSRTELWSKTVSIILAQPILGTGYYASRYVLLKDFPWAGHAHNSFLEILLTTGAVGLLILFGFLLLTVKELVTTRSALLLGATLYCLIAGIVNPVLFSPNVAMFVLIIALVYAPFNKLEALTRSSD